MPSGSPAASAFPRTSFVGRADELEALGAMLDEVRLVTVLGPGGIGKTRLVLRFMADRFPSPPDEDHGGSWFVELSRVGSVSEALHGIARGLGIDLGGLSEREDISAAIGHGVAQRERSLVVLDNVEHVADRLAMDLDRWLRRAPSLRLVVTSRVAMPTNAGRVLTLGPLSPADATELFVDRARAVRAEIDLSDRGLAQSIVERVDCLPLAVELAASRTRILSLADIRARLDEPLALLAGKGTNARHRSLRLVVTDSVALLSGPAQRVFGLASVLRNGFTLRDLEACVGPVWGEHREVELIDAVDEIVRTSLLRVSVGGAHARYRYFEVIRSLAEELAAADEGRNAVLDGVCTHYAQRAADGDVDADEQLDNYLLAHEHAVRSATAAPRSMRRAVEALALARALEPFFEARGHSEGRRRLFDGALSALRGTDADDVRVAQALIGRGSAQRELGASIPAKEDFEAALAMARSAGLDGLAAVALTKLGGLLDVAGDTGAARLLLEEALALLHETEDSRRRLSCEAEAMLLLAHAYRREGALKEAQEVAGGAVARFRQLGNDARLSAGLYELGVVALFGADCEQARAIFEEGLEVAVRSRVQLFEGAFLYALGCVLQEEGHLDGALDRYAASARMFAALGRRHREASALYYLATAFAERGEGAEALSILEQALGRIASVGSPHYEALIHACRSSTLATLERGDEALAAAMAAEEALARVEHEPSLAATVAIHRAIVDVEAGREDADRALQVARQWVAVSPNDDARFALRMLQGVAAGWPDRSAQEALTVWPEGLAFRLPHGDDRVPLRRDSPSSRILWRLAQLRVDEPGESLSIDDVIAAGWPNEKIGAEAALNRAYVALSTLRKKGLKGILVRAAGGYAISQAVMVRFEAD